MSDGVNYLLRGSFAALCLWWNIFGGIKGCGRWWQGRLSVPREGWGSEGDASPLTDPERYTWSSLKTLNSRQSPVLRRLVINIVNLIKVSRQRNYEGDSSVITGGRLKRWFVSARLTRVSCPWNVRRTALHEVAWFWVWFCSSKSPKSYNWFNN